MTLRIGISARLLHEAPPGLGLPQKPLQFLESSMAHWVMAHRAIALMIPFVDEDSPTLTDPTPLSDMAHLLDGLVLQGGIDVCPESYGSTPLKPEWRGDPIRDRYELALLHAFIRAGKPVLGICRGAQLINVFYGGSLVQDIPSQWPGAQIHQDLTRYDRLVHEVEFVPGSRLATLYPTASRHCITSIHHQCVDRLGEGLVAEAYSAQDGIIEAIRHTGPGFVMGVQWHPEFHLSPREEAQCLLDSGPVMQAFLDAARARADRHQAGRAQSGSHG
jgi:putative glutamine amidotransferase